MIAFHIIAKPIGPICNLNCSYCFYLEKENLYPDHRNWRMSDEVLESFVRQYLQCNEAPVVNFAWQGGEPTLLGIDFFKTVVALQKRYADGKTIENAFQTNGILLNDQWCEFLAENRFLVGLSLDGPENLHNMHRVDKAGQGSFDRVMQGLERLKKHGVEFNILTAVNRANSQLPLEVYHFLKQVGSGFIQFIPIVERVRISHHHPHRQLVSPDDQSEAVVADWSVEPVQFGKFLIEIFDEWVRNDVGRQFIQLFEVALQRWSGQEPSLCLFAETCGKALAIEHNGDLYSCDHFVYPTHRLGNILERSLIELVTSDQQRRFGNNKHDRLPQFCHDCSVLFICRGECPKNRFMQTPTGQVGLNYLCEGYRVFFEHIDLYMKFMANELRHCRAPANVMSWARAKDHGFPGLDIGRNDPCPCGSGKKFKKCCEQNRRRIAAP
ncbi:MAG: anaerobic sulfatase-maturation protein [candidate division KSB1 bacterium]|nr:anaerobic sulfatase-maturation protein [candidate division KSB1 bacterium]MDZ7335778.1 anaerobic sulfatase-maturation protein [candidate division KSB1 bacterium]MDZ7359053.1 anaerobic sulfatase-maturation protein [candidate division KSB1 bacterium]MDZ7400765.1 anaerobic sulfatase-maturation protein [candidate division KSB1 bacterium]